MLRSHFVSLDKLAMRATASRINAFGIRLLSTETKNNAPGGRKSQPYPNLAPDEIPEGPGVFATITAMVSGAGGAVLIAGVGTWAVFKMAFYVAGETGRSMRASETEKKTSESASEKSASPTVATPLEPSLVGLTLAACSPLDGTRRRLAEMVEGHGWAVRGLA